MTVDIGPKIGIDGEKAFRRDLQNISNQLKITRAEMDKVKSSFDDSEQSCKQSTEALVVMHRQLKLLKEQQEKAEAALRNAARTYGENSTQTDKWRLVIAKSEAEQAKLEKSIKETQSAIVQNTRIVKDNTDAVDNNVGALSDLGGVLTGAGLAAGLKTLADAMWSTVKASVEFESAITGVYKTVDGTDAELAALAGGIKELATEIPASAAELAGVAEAAGQLGIARESILDFIRTMSMLGTATNMSADEAATALARFANVAGTDAADYSRLGSVIVALGNNLATTESEITEMAQRLASAGTLAGLSEAQIMALAASMSSVGIEAEAGGTAMTQTLAAISEAAELGGDKLNELARVAGMSADDFSALWARDAVGALQQFILGLGRLEAEGESSVMVLDELGMSGVRQSNMLRSLALAGEQLTGAVELANTAWAENTALTKEAEQRYDTTESKLQLLANAGERLAAAYGDTLTPAVGTFSEVAADGVNALAGLVEEVPELANVLTAAVAGLSTFTVGAGGLAAVHTWGGKAATALKALGTAAAANPAGLAVTGVVALTAALVTLAATSEKGESEFAGLAAAIRSAGEEWSKQTALMAEQREKAEGLADQLEYLQENTDGSAAASQALQNVQQQLLAAVPELAEYINAETGALEGNWRQALENAAATDEQAAAMERQAAVAAELTEVQAELAEREAEIQKLEAEGITLADAAAGGYSKLNPVMREKYERMRELGIAANDLRNAEALLLGQQEELEAAAAGWAEKAADVVTVVDETMQKAVEHMDVSEGAEQAAANTVQGYIGGIEELVPRLNSAMRNAGRGGLAAFNSELDIHSPSREFAESGRNSVRGYIEGADDMADSMAEAMRDIGQAALDSFGAGAADGSGAAIAAMQAEADAAWKLAQATYSDFDRLQKALKKAYQTGLFSEEAYYKKLLALRERYLRPEDEGWADISLDVYEFELARLEDAVDGFLDSYETTLEEAAAATGDLLNGIKDEYDDLLKEQEKLQSRLQGYGDLYDEISLKYSDGSTGEYYRLNDLGEQIDALREYQSVISSLEGRQISGSLMDEVLSMDVDAAVRYGRELLKKSDAEWNEYNRQWEEKQALAAKIAEEYYRDELTALEEDYAAMLREGLDSLKEISNDAGENVVSGLINGMEAKEAELRRQMQEIADVIESELRESLDMHSPSRRLEELGEMAGEGLLVGWEEKLEAFRESVLSAVPNDLTVNYASQGGRERDCTMLDALGTMFGAAAMPGGDMTVVFRINDIDFARATLPAFRRAGAENPVVEVDF